MQRATTSLTDARPDAETTTPGRRPVCLLFHLLRRILVLAAWCASIFLTVVFVRAFDARGMADLKPWHTERLKAEWHVGDITLRTSLDDYLAMEDRLFAELDAKITQQVSPEDRIAANRYWPGSPLCLRKGNRTFILEPDGPPRGAALMLHGLTDAPYSMHRLAEVYRDRGFFVLVLRMPGHGTIPGELLRANWQDWLAATQLGMRAVRERAGAGNPIHLVGYSNGGALAIKYTLDALECHSGEEPTRLVLISPMIGVSPASGFARLITFASVFPYFEKARWLDIMPEYIPYKYNSFCANAAQQSHEISVAIQEQIHRLAKSGRIVDLPPVLTFQSIVDATVSTPAVVNILYDHIRNPSSQLVVFDVNSHASAQPFIRPSDLTFVERLLSERTRHYRLAVIRNANALTNALVELSAEADSADVVRRPLDLAWPPNVYSLTHTALPIPPDDPVYGFEGLVGRITPRGEKGVLTVPVSQFMRLNCNPFFSYLSEQLIAALPAAPPTAPGAGHDGF